MKVFRVGCAAASAILLIATLSRQASAQALMAPGFQIGPGLTIANGVLANGAPYSDAAAKAAALTITEFTAPTVHSPTMDGTVTINGSLAATASTMASQLASYLTSASASAIYETAAAHTASLAGYDTITARATAISSLALPSPASSTPNPEAVGGAVGTATTYMRSDAKMPRITRAATVVTDASGNWSVTWSTPLSAPAATLPVPLNVSTMPLFCNVATSTAAGATGKCWGGQLLPASLTLVTSLQGYNVYAGSAASVSVMVFAIPPTQ